MPTRDPLDQRLQRLRQWRNRAEPDRSLAFIKEQFKREIERPHKQLGTLVEVWDRLVPADLARHTRLESLARGHLRVAVDSSARLFDLDRLLRGGLEQALVTEFHGPAFRRVQLRVAPFDDPPTTPAPTDDANEDPDAIT